MKKLILTPLLLLSLVACQNADEPHVSQTAAINFGAAGSRVGIEWEAGQVASRAADDIDSEMPEDIGVFAYYNKTTDQEVFNNQKVLYFYSKEYTAAPFQWEYWDGVAANGISAWPYTITAGGSEQKPWVRRNYRFVAYSPWSAGGASVSTADYGFNTLNWADIPEYSDRDHLIAKRIVDVDNTGGAWKTTNPVTFEMQHLMARVRFIFKMSDQYRQIRRIVINSVSVKSSGKQNSAAIDYKADNTLNTVTWGGLTSGAPTTLDLIKANDEDYDVMTDYAEATPFASLYILPQSGFKELTLTVNYSTYDSAGKKTRDASITNTVTLTDPWNLRAGRYYDLKISIVPDYLYVLSDNDQDFDGWVIVKES